MTYTHRTTVEPWAAVADQLAACRAAALKAHADAQALATYGDVSRPTDLARRAMRQFHGRAMSAACTALIEWEKACRNEAARVANARRRSSAA
jgi:hypothetical protein